MAEGTKIFQPNWTLNDFLGGTTGLTTAQLKDADWLYEYGFPS